MTPDIERYIKLRYYLDYVVPLCIFIAVVVIAALVFLITRIVRLWEKRQKKRSDEYWRRKGGTNP